MTYYQNKGLHLIKTHSECNLTEISLLLLNEICRHIHICKQFHLDLLKNSFATNVAFLKIGLSE